MSAYTGPPGNNYPPLQQLHPNLHPHPYSAGQGATDTVPAHHIPVTQSYSYEPLPHPHLQLPYSNEPPNGGGHLQPHAHGQDNERAEQLQQPPSALAHASAPLSVAGVGGAVERKEKSNRLRKACDSCSVRKVKCDESGPPCRGCKGLDIPCTFDRVSKRRGPPNKHAEAIKKQRLESPGSAPGPSGLTSPNSTSNIAQTLVSISSYPVHSTHKDGEAICPLPALELLVDDFFTYIHPICPFPHEPSFRAAFKDRMDQRNPSFLALLASMVEILVVSFPRRPRMHLKAQLPDDLFPKSHMNLVERCHKVAVEARGPGYLDKELTVYDAITSYFLGLSGAYTFQWKQARLYFGETLSITRIVGAHRVYEHAAPPREPQLQSYDAAPQVASSDNSPVDCIKQEMGRRVFWIMFVTIRSIQQHGASLAELLIPPPTRNEPYPPFPAEVDDEYIYVDRVEAQPEGVVSQLVGFNLNLRIYSALTPLATTELVYGIDEVFDWGRQKQVLEDCLRSVKQVLDTAPREFQLHTGPPTAPMGTPLQQQFYPSMSDDAANPAAGSETRWYDPGSQGKRYVQLEIQKANIHASQLGTRCYLVEKYWTLLESYERSIGKPHEGEPMSSPGLVSKRLERNIPLAEPKRNHDDGSSKLMFEREGETVVQDLFSMLCTINQINMEPNGGSLQHKIRKVASTLMDSPQIRKGPLAARAEQYLNKFLEVLTKLEKVSLSFQSDVADAVEDDEEELRNWADLREYQMRFAQAGGFLGVQ